MMRTLLTNRLILRPLSEDDAPEIYQLRSDEQVNRYLHRQPAKSIHDALAFIHSINRAAEESNTAYWAISRHGEEKLVGTICLFAFTDEPASAEIGYEILPACQGKGIATEAALCVIDYAFSSLNRTSLEATCHLHNAASLQLLTNLGFTRVGTPDTEDPLLEHYRLTT